MDALAVSIVPLYLSAAIDIQNGNYAISYFFPVIRLYPSHAAQIDLQQLETQMSEILNNDEKLTKQNLQYVELREILTHTKTFFSEVSWFI